MLGEAVPPAQGRSALMWDAFRPYSRRGAGRDHPRMNPLHRLLVADVMTVEPVMVLSDAHLEDAEGLMRAHDVSSLPVVDGNELLVGVISQSDVLAVRGMSIGAVVRHRPSGVRVGEVMSSPAITVPLTCSLVEAARRMRDARVHRLVAVADDGRPVGVLSAIDYVGIVADA